MKFYQKSPFRIFRQNLQGFSNCIENTQLYMHTRNYLLDKIVAFALRLGIHIYHTQQQNSFCSYQILSTIT